jgi:hypothetical protein
MELPSVEISSVLPEFCGRPVPPKNPNCYSCNIIEKVKAKMADKDQINLAIKTFLDVQLEVQSSIDNITGSMLGQHFSLSVVVVAQPSLRADESLDLTSIVSFHPLQNVLKPTKEHKRVFCPCVKKFITKLAGFGDDDVRDKDCAWADEVDTTGKVIGQKRALLQSNSGTGSNTGSVTMNFPPAAVRRVLGSVTFSPSTANANFTNNSASSSVVQSFMFLILAFLAGKMFGV